jgi:phosphatidylserine decarboxylase
MSYLVLILVLLIGVCLLAALSQKWCLPAGSAGGIILLATLGAAILGIILQWSSASGWVCGSGVLGAQCFGYLGILLFRFYRDPERVSPRDPNVLVSPADGTVIYIKKLSSGHVLQSEKKGSRLVLDELNGVALASQELWQIGISMVFTDVHVNRAPTPGRVTLVRHRPGRFLSLRRDDALNVNERQTLLIENEALQLAIVQIASRLVRRIEAYVREGEQLQLGQRIGIIKFGSQVDLFVPTAQVSNLCLDLNQRVVAGETVIARLTRRPATISPARVRDANHALA